MARQNELEYSYNPLTLYFELPRAIATATRLIQNVTCDGNATWRAGYTRQQDHIDIVSFIFLSRQTTQTPRYDEERKALESILEGSIVVQVIQLDRAVQNAQSASDHLQKTLTLFEEAGNRPQLLFEHSLE